MQCTNTENRRAFFDIQKGSRRNIAFRFCKCEPNLFNVHVRLYTNLEAPQGMTGKAGFSGEFSYRKHASL